jgi:hypothetical protein
MQAVDYAFSPPLAKTIDRIPAELGAIPVAGIIE